MPNAANARREDSPKLLVSLATFDESGNLRPLIEEIRRYAPLASILIIDDNSPDGTGQLADELQTTLPRIHVIHRPRKLGLGTAMLEGMHFAIENGFDFCSTSMPTSATRPGSSRRCSPGCATVMS